MDKESSNEESQSTLARLLRWERKVFQICAYFGLIFLVLGPFSLLFLNSAASGENSMSLIDFGVVFVRTFGVLFVFLSIIGGTSILISTARKSEPDN